MNNLFNNDNMEDRSTISLSIDANLNIYYYQNDKFVNVSGAMLVKMMKDYGIIWGQKGLNVIPSYEKVVAAIDKSICDLQKNESVYVKWREDYELGFAHYYNVELLDETKRFGK